MVSRFAVFIPLHANPPTAPPHPLRKAGSNRCLTTAPSLGFLLWNGDLRGEQVTGLVGRAAARTPFWLLVSCSSCVNKTLIMVKARSSARGHCCGGEFSKWTRVQPSQPFDLICLLKLCDSLFILFPLWDSGELPSFPPRTYCGQCTPGTHWHLSS